MKRGLLLPALLTVVAAVSAHAQIVFTDVTSITEDPSQIIADGSVVDAAGADDGTAFVKVGNITFNSIFSDSRITFSSNTQGGTDGSGSNATDFKKVLNGVIYTGDFTSTPMTATVSLNNLTVGQTYAVQVFSLGGYGVDLNSSVPLKNQFAVAEFVATGTGPFTSQTFTFDSQTSGAGEINAIVLEEVPEPSTYALMGLALVVGTLLMRVRRLAA